MKVTIEYCKQWNYEPRASSLGAEISDKFDSEIDLIPGSGGVFEISLDGNKVFSKKALGRFPVEGEIEGLLADHSRWLFHGELDQFV